MSDEKKTVLCVDDEISILHALKRLLRKENYCLLTASSAEEGLDILKDNPVHVVMSDQRMPSMSGIRFIRKVREMYPETVRVILSGYADMNEMSEAMYNGDIYRFLSKPWNDEELKTIIRECLEYYPSE